MLIGFQAGIDLDQKEIQDLLGQDTPAFSQAKQVYEQGAHSKSVAKITTTSALTQDFEKGSKVTGKTADGEEVIGKLYSAAKSGESELLVQYKVGEDSLSYSTCTVGGSSEAVTTGCKYKHFPFYVIPDDSDVFFFTQASIAMADL